jgi:hypothetical protein
MEGEKDTGNMELKTNEDGKTVIDVLPIGDTVRLQIIAKGFQTFGDDYKIDKAEMAIEIRLKRPGEQYSIYKPTRGRRGRQELRMRPAGESAQPKERTPGTSGQARAAQPDAEPGQASPAEVIVGHVVVAES